MPDEQTPRKAGKRADIIAIAREQFFTNGYAGTSMSQLAARLGGSKTTLYNHFPSKEDLLHAVVGDLVAENPKEYDPASEPSKFRAWLEWFGVICVKRITTNNYISMQRLAAAEALRFPEIGKTFQKAIEARYDMAATLFEKAMNDGVLRRADSRLAAEHFLELCSGWMLRAVIWNTRPPPDEAEIVAAVRAAVNVFLDGYAVTKDGRTAPTPRRRKS